MMNTLTLYAYKATRAPSKKLTWSTFFYTHEYASSNQIEHTRNIIRLFSSELQLELGYSSSGVEAFGTGSGALGGFKT